MPSDLTDDERAAARRLLGRFAEASIGAAFENVLEPVKVGKAVGQKVAETLDGFLRLGWSPRRTGAAETGAGNARAAAEAMRRAAVSVGDIVEYQDRPDWAKQGAWAHAVELFKMRIAALPLPAAPTPDAISAAEARGRREGIEEAAEVVDAERKAFRCAGIKDVADVLDFVAAKTRALSSIPPQEADPT